MASTKLSRNRETLRQLGDDAANNVAGGMISGAKISCMGCTSAAPGACTWWPGCAPTGEQC